MLIFRRINEHGNLNIQPADFRGHYGPEKAVGVYHFQSAQDAGGGPEHPHQLCMTLVREVLYETGITATGGIGTNMYLCG